MAQTTHSRVERNLHTAELMALQRSVHRLAVRLESARQQRLASNADSVLDEREEQVQFEVHGDASMTPGTVFVDVDFTQAFTASNGRRMSQLLVPHVWFGFEQRAANAGGAPATVPVILAGIVTAWTRQDGVNITGARLAVTAMAATPITFRAVVHATFQGYGMPRDPETDLEN